MEEVCEDRDAAALKGGWAGVGFMVYVVFGEGGRYERLGVGVHRCCHKGTQAVEDMVLEGEVFAGEGAGGNVRR